MAAPFQSRTRPIAKHCNIVDVSDSSAGEAGEVEGRVEVSDSCSDDGGAAPASNANSSNGRGLTQEANCSAAEN